MLDYGMTDEEFRRSFDAMWDRQMLDYPTITRDEAGEWNYFDVTEREDDDANTAWAQGEALARKTWSWLAATPRLTTARSP
jgi:hypothetical protein